MSGYKYNKIWRKNNPEKWAAIKQRYYSRSIKNAHNSYQPWSNQDINIILVKEHCDSVLSKIIGRSIKAIQVKRSNLLKEEVINE